MILQKKHNIFDLFLPFPTIPDHFYPLLPNTVHFLQPGNICLNHFQRFYAKLCYDLFRIFRSNTFDQTGTEIFFNTKYCGRKRFFPALCCKLSAVTTVHFPISINQQYRTNIHIQQTSDDCHKFFVTFYGTFEDRVTVFRILISNAFHHTPDFYCKMLRSLLNFYALQLHIFILHLMTVCLIIYRIFRFLTDTSICCFRCFFSGFLHTPLMCLTHLRHHALIHFLVHVTVIQCSMCTFR